MNAQTAPPDTIAFGRDGWLDDAGAKNANDVRPPVQRQIGVGQPFDICLHELPTSGYRWRLEPGSGLELYSERYEPQRHESPGVIRLGIGGRHRFRLRLSVDHPTRAIFSLVRPWQLDGPSINQHVFEFTPAASR
jgi:predicted secreted protein